MSSANVELLNVWRQKAPNRVVNTENRCPCANCCNVSNICAICNIWDCIDWNSCNQPNIMITCTEVDCKNSFHLNCLTPSKRTDWKKCQDLDIRCSKKYVDLFTFVQRIDNIKYKKYDDLIMCKMNDIFPNRKTTIQNHFFGFVYNKYTYYIHDVAEIELNGDEAPGNARIINIFKANNKAYILCAWYWNKADYTRDVYDKNVKEYLFAKDPAIVEILSITGKVKCCDNIKEMKQHLLTLNHLKMQKQAEITKLEKNKKFKKLCLAKHITGFGEGYKNVFWCNKMCNADLKCKKIEELDRIDTDKYRMELQRKTLQILNGQIEAKQQVQLENTNNALNTKRKKRKREEIDDAEEIEKKRYKISRESLEKTILKMKEEILLLKRSSFNEEQRYKISRESLEKTMLKMKEELKNAEVLKKSGKQKRAILRKENRELKNSVTELKQELEGIITELQYFKNISQKQTQPQQPQFLISSIDNKRNKAQQRVGLSQKNMYSDEIHRLFD